MTAKPLWIPSRERTRASNLAAFAAWLAEEGGPSPDLPRPPAPYHALWRWSI